MHRSRLLGAISVALVLSLFGGFAGTAHADTADDVAIMLDNLPAATDALAAGVQEAVDTLAATQSAEDTAAEIGQALVAAGSALIAGTEQFGQLGFGLSLFNGALQNTVRPYLQAIDDPSTAGDLVNPDDLTTLANNVQPTLDEVLPYLTSAIVEGLKGNLVAGGILPGLGTPALLGDAANALFGAALYLPQGTNYANVGGLPLVPALVVGGLLADPFQQLEDGLAPLFDALGPVTEPIIAAIEGV